MKNFVSVLLPTYNGSRTIRRAIDSVLSQTHQDVELIVIDDGCRDATDKIVGELTRTDARIKLISFENNRGIQQALAAGFKAAQGEYIARIDDDDQWVDTEKLEKQLAYMTAHPDCALVGTGLVVADELGSESYRFLNPETDSEIRKRILYRNCFSHSTVLFKKSAAEKFGGYDTTEKTQHLEDYDLWLKLGTVGSFANLPEYSVRLTAHKRTISGKHKLQQFKNQLVLLRHSHFLKKVRMSYPGYTRAVVKSYVRLILYAIFGALIPTRIQNTFIEKYKNI